MLAYLATAYEGWRSGEVFVPARATTTKLGLDAHDEQDFLNELHELGLIRIWQLIGADVPYRLLPRGIAFMERHPSLEHLLARQFASIDEAPKAPPAEKQQAKVDLKAELYKAAVGKGAEWVFANLPTLLDGLRRIYSWLPSGPGAPPPGSFTV